MRRGRKKARGLAILAATVVLAESFMGLGIAFGEPEAGEVTRVWDFEDGDQGWVYDDSWAGDSYQGEGSCEYDADKGMLRLKLDYSRNVNNSYSQTGICLAEEDGIDYSSYKVLNFDLYYDPTAFTTGQLSVKAFSNNIFGDQSCRVMETPAEDVDGLKLVNL